MKVLVDSCVVVDVLQDKESLSILLTYENTSQFRLYCGLQNIISKVPET